MSARLSRRDLTGEPIENVICVLLHELDNINYVTVFIPRPVPPIQERLRSSEPVLEIVDKGLQIRNALGLPFWDAVNLACFGRGAMAAAVLSEALFHNGDCVR
jgi:hypothetical protein